MEKRVARNLILIPTSWVVTSLTMGPTLRIAKWAVRHSSICTMHSITLWTRTLQGCAGERHLLKNVHILFIKFGLMFDSLLSYQIWIPRCATRHAKYQAFSRLGEEERYRFRAWKEQAKKSRKCYVSRPWWHECEGDQSWHQSASRHRYSFLTISLSLLSAPLFFVSFMCTYNLMFLYH